MLKKISFKPGINRENTRWFTAGGWYDGDKIRFRQGTPQKLGGWDKISSVLYQGVCRSLWSWETLGNVNLIGVGTNLKFYISQGGAYYDITPIRAAANVATPFAATNGSTTIVVTAASHGALNGDFVTFNGATSLGGAITATVLNKEYQITYLTTNTFSITTSVAANASDTGNGGTTRMVYQLSVGAANQVASTGYGAGGWGSGTWSNSSSTASDLRLWSQSNFGQDLIFGPHGGALYYSYAARGLTPITITITLASPGVVTLPSVSYLAENGPVILETSGVLPTGLETGTTYYVKNLNVIPGTCNLSLTPGGASINTSGAQSGTHAISIRAVNLTTIPGASYVPTVQNIISISDTNRFVFAFGCNDYNASIQDPLLVRWSDQENAADWSVISLTNQAGSLRLTRGSKIVAAQQARQEVIVWTDSALYSMQYLGYPLVWNAQLMGDNISIASENCVAVASGVVYWMGRSKFYKYDGHVQTLRCDLREYIFDDFNTGQIEQVYAGTNERFTEIWWFYCSASATQNDRYVIYNYGEDIWYYGTMARSAWLDSGMLTYPLGATYVNNLVNHESGVDDNSGTNSVAIDSYISSSEMSVDDGDRFVFIRRLLPDITFRGSVTGTGGAVYPTPNVTMTILPMTNAGSGYESPPSIGLVDSAVVTQGATIPIEQFTGQAFVRIRGRQIIFKVESTDLGVMWQLGAPRLDYQIDGKRGG